ncbi:hypothetical protein MYSTI_01525 [Myxococcus stipitatus DSM 14675]|uniref:Uncharacterized protein n=1 Tax=Myxococcus stipitatus (strain DSM 14675 / JCM 12634 / Mx s8) TaxID=1278073 RepID=L7U4V1_MYXSD|nr:hypothetical protein MYSTI_01525 [Myxococcus stipitatus DSM 14675]
MISRVSSPESIPNEVTVGAATFKVELQTLGGANSVTLGTGAGNTITAECDSAIAQSDCTTVRQALGWAVNGSPTSTRLTADLRIPGASAKVDVINTLPGEKLGSTLVSFDVTVADTAEDRGENRGGGNRPLPCEARAAADAADYSAEANRAEIVSTENGTVLSGDLSQVDENDTVRVNVVTTRENFSSLAVRRISPIRDVTAFRLLGGQQVRPQSVTDCVVFTATVQDFDPGVGQIEIARRETNGEFTRLGLIEFNVHPLYRGMLSFGAVWTGLNDPMFGTVSTPGGTLISRGEVGSHRLLYAVLLTPFIWGRRDMEKEPALLSDLFERGRSLEALSLFRHFNPSVGLVVNDPLDNALAGISLDLFDGVLITGGVHVGRVTVIDPQSGLTEGSVFDGPEEDLPTARRWRTSAFWSVSVDLRAAVQLIQGVLSPPAGRR